MRRHDGSVLAKLFTSAARMQRALTRFKWSQKSSSA